jgi:ATP-dependent Clp protease adaptor protein ClpS
MAETNQVVEEKTKQKPQPKTGTKPASRELPPYHVVLLDDNEHTYDYVIDMLQSLFSHSEEQAYLLAHQVDKTGRAIVCTTHKERAELKRDQISGYGCDFRISSSKNSMKALIQPAEG